MECSRLNLENRTLKIGYVNSQPYTYIDYMSANNAHIVRGGIESKMMDLFSKRFNFSIEFIDMEYSGSFGSRMGNGSWSGIIGAIAAHRIDLGIGGIHLTYGRSSIVKFLYPHYYGRMSFGTTKPKEVIDWDLLLKPFEWKVWLCLVFSFILFFGFDKIKHQINSFAHESLLMKQKQFKRKNHKKQLESDSIVWISFCLLLRQPYEWSEKSRISSKICAFIWIILAMVLANVYGGCLCSLLAIPTRHAIDTVEKLAQQCDQNKIIGLVGANTSSVNIFEKSQVSTFISVRRTMQQMIGLDPRIKKVIAAEQNHEPVQYAAISARDRLKYARLYIPAKTLYIPPDTYESSFFTLMFAIPYSETFPYRDHFDTEISRMYSSGIFEHWKSFDVVKLRAKMHSDDDPEEEDNYYFNENQTEFKKFTLEHMESLFYFFSIMIAISFLVFIIELWHVKQKKHAPNIMKAHKTPPIDLTVFSFVRF